MEKSHTYRALTERIDLLPPSCSYRILPCGRTHKAALLNFLLMTVSVFSLFLSLIHSSNNPHYTPQQPNSTTQHQPITMTLTSWPPSENADANPVAPPRQVWYCMRDDQESDDDPKKREWRKAIVQWSSEPRPPNACGPFELNQICPEHNWASDQIFRGMMPQVLDVAFCRYDEGRIEERWAKPKRGIPGPHLSNPMRDVFMKLPRWIEGLRREAWNLSKRLEWTGIEGLELVSMLRRLTGDRELYERQFQIG